MYRVKNWAKFQHYGDRNPPWVKLHVEILISEDWLVLSDASKLHMIACMLVASRNKGTIPNKPSYIKELCRLKSFDFKPLVDCGFLIPEGQTLADASTKVLADATPSSLILGSKRSKFLIPSLDEVSQYCNTRKNGIDAQAFIDFYSSKGWRIGNTPMKDWQAAIRTWEKRKQLESKPTTSKPRYCYHDGCPAKATTQTDFKWHCDKHDPIRLDKTDLASGDDFKKAMAKLGEIGRE